MSKWTPGVTLLSGVLLSSGPALAQTTEFSRGQTTVVVGANTITADNNVKFVNYTADETIPVTLSYSATCNIVFGGLTLRLPQPFTPPQRVRNHQRRQRHAAGNSGHQRLSHLRYRVHFLEDRREEGLWCGSPEPRHRRRFRL